MDRTVAYCTRPAPVPQVPRSNPSPNFNTHAETDGSRAGTRHHPLPFSALPHQLRRDLKGNHTAISLAAALLEYAGVKPYCYPTTARLAADLGVCQNTVRAALHALERAGWVRVVLGANQPNGRRIWLTWLESGTTQPVGGTGSGPVRGRPAVRQVSDPLQPVGAPLQSAGATPQPVAAPLQPAGPEIRTFERI